MKTMRLIMFYLTALFIGYFLAGIANVYRREYNNKVTIENLRRMTR